MLNVQLQRMSRGGTLSWWDFSSTASDKMTYQCDPGLGTLSAADCSEIQLPLSSDTLAVSPGTTTFFHQKTCYMAITASVALILSWAQVSTALAALMNTCVRQLTPGTQGGRAFYGAPAALERNGQNLKPPSETDGLIGMLEICHCTTN